MSKLHMAAVLAAFTFLSACTDPSSRWDAIYSVAPVGTSESQLEP